MTHEELYLIIDGARHKLDLPSNSGVSLKFVNNIFSDLGKFTSSYSYTFNLPMSVNNRNVLQSPEEIRMSNTLLKKYTDAEYIVNGVPLVRNANLYIEDVSNGAYKCVLTWGIARGFQKMKDNSVSLQSLPIRGEASWDTGYIFDFPANEFGTYQCGIYGIYKYTRGDVTRICPWDNLQNILYPTYSAGIPFADRSRYQVTNGEVLSRLHCPPKPVVPVMRLLQAINAMYGINISIGELKDSDEIYSKTADTYNVDRKDDYVTYGVIPLTGIGAADASQYAYSTKGSAMTTVPMFGISCITPYMDKIEGNAVIRPLVLHGDFFTGEQNIQFTLVNSLQYNVIGFGIKIPVFVRGKAVVRVAGKTMSEMRQLRIFLVKVGQKGLWGSGNYEDQKVAEIRPTSEPTPNEEYPSFYNIEFDFGLNEEYEYNTISVPYDYDEEHDVPGEDSGYVGYMITPTQTDANSERIYITSLQYTVVPQQNEGIDEAIPLDIATNLPDISCFDFVKSLFLMCGAFPVVFNDGAITPIYYSDLRDNIANGNVVDWSSKLIGAASDLPDEVKFHNSGIAQRNYYLMKSDDRAKSKEEALVETDVYANGVGIITINDATLNDEAEVFTAPFFAPYILNRDDFRISVGNTIKAWKEDNTIVESNPAYGYIYFENDRMRMSIWNPFVNMTDSFQYLQTLLNDAYYIKEKMNLSEMDLYELDYTKPVYIDKYNAYFGIKTIQRNSDGVCTVELVKLPNI